MDERAAEYDWSQSSLPPNHRLSAREHEILKEFVEITRLVQVALVEWQGANNPTISTVIPGVYCLLTKIGAILFLCMIILD